MENKPLLNDEELNQAIEKTPAPKVTEAMIKNRIAHVGYHVLPGNPASPGARVTICEITLNNGFSVRGESACVNPENYREDIGRTIAYKNAFDRLWPLFGFLLAEDQHRYKVAMENNDPSEHDRLPD